MNRRDNPYNADDTCRFCSTEQREDCEKAHCKEWEDEFERENVWQEGYDAAVEDMKAVKNGIIINGTVYELVVEDDSIGYECKNCDLFKFCYSLEEDKDLLCNTISVGVGLRKVGSLFKKVK